MWGCRTIYTGKILLCSTLLQIYVTAPRYNISSKLMVAHLAIKMEQYNQHKHSEDYLEMICFCFSSVHHANCHCLCASVTCFVHPDEKGQTDISKHVTWTAKVRFKYIPGNNWFLYTSLWMKIHFFLYNNKLFVFFSFLEIGFVVVQGLYRWCIQGHIDVI